MKLEIVTKTKKFHPQIIDSLFAKATVLLTLIASTVGCKPAIPTTADMVKSIFSGKFEKLNFI